MIISAEKKAEYLQEIMGIQHHLQSCEENINLTSKVLEKNATIKFETKEGESAKERSEKEEEIISQIVNYNHEIALTCFKDTISSAKDLIDLERICRERISRKVIKEQILQKQFKSFSKIDKWIYIPNANSILERYNSNERSIITISSNFTYENDVIDIRSAITINTIPNIQFPSLDELISSLAF